MSLKLAAFSAFTIAFAFLFGYSFALFASGFGYVYLIFSAITALLFLSLFFLQTIIISEITKASLLIFLEAAAMSASFVFYSAKWPLLVFLAVFIIFLWAHQSGRLALSSMLKVNLFKLRHNVLFYASTAVLVFAVANYFIFIGGRELVISRSAVDLSARPLVPIVGRFVPNFSLKTSTEEVLKAIAYRSYGEDIDVQTSVFQLKETINQMIGAQLRLDEDIVTALHKIINSFIAKTPEQLRGRLLFFFALATFIFVGSGTYFVSVFATILAWLIFHLLLATRFIYITYKDAKREVVNT